MKVKHKTQARLIKTRRLAKPCLRRATPTLISTNRYILNKHSILVRKLLKRASFLSQDDLKTRIFDFINYFNQTMAKPLKWTYTGKVLAI